MVITIKERFRTFAKYSRFMIEPSLLAIVLVIYCLNKDIVSGWYGFIKPINIPHFGKFCQNFTGVG